jgi:hypothetical protein
MSAIRLTFVSVVLTAAYVGPTASWAAAATPGAAGAHDAGFVSGTVSPPAPTAFRTALATLVGVALAGSLRRKPLYR